MKLADFVLRLLLTRRNRETISGDLLEEYREVVLPARGRFRGSVWYWRQVLSFMSPLAIGVTFGTLLGVANLIDTAVEPLADDSGAVMLAFAAVLLGTWAAVAFLAGRRTQSFWQAVLAGMFVGAATLTLFALANFIRVNVFLETIQHREDWRNLMARFRESDYQSLRAFVNRDYLTSTLAAGLVGAAAGAVAGAVSGTVSALVPMRRASSH
jgi:hypothetical protein